MNHPQSETKSLIKASWEFHDPDSTVYDYTGRAHLLASIYKDKQVFIVFIRNFLWYPCRDQVRGLAQLVRSAELKNKGIVVKLFQLSKVIGCGKPSGIVPFCKDTGFPFD
jgi:hypothetical protein